MTRVEIDILDGTKKISSEEISGHLHISGDDVVVLGGTLVEGIGNAFSDLDVYVLTERRKKYREVKAHQHVFVHKKDMAACVQDDDEVFLTMDYYPNSSMHLDIEYWTYDEASEILDKVNRGYEDLFRHSDVAYEETSFSKRQKNFIHRMLGGVLTFGSSSWKEKISHCCDGRYSYILYRMCANNYWKYKDICGAVIAENPLLSCESARKFLLDEVRAAIFLRGVTNHTERWSTTYFSKPSMGVDLKLKKEIMSLLFSVDLDDSVSYVKRVLRSIDLLERENREIVDSNDMFLSTAQSLSLLEQEISTRREDEPDQIQHEYLFRRRSFDGAGPDYFELLTFFD